jgi:hypothetical protein
MDFRHCLTKYIANDFETVAFSDESCTDSEYKVAVAESIGDVSLVM